VTPPQADQGGSPPPPATVLAFDTSGPVGSAAVGREGRTLAHAVITRRAEHASGIVPLVERVLREAGVGRADLDALVVGEGPGSFTGVRVAAATAKGLSRSLEVPLWAASSLAAAAMSVEEGATRYALFDARAERVYGACYRRVDERVETLFEPHAGELADVLSGDVPRGAVFLGNGAEKHRATIERAGFIVRAASADRPLAVGLLELLWHPSDARVVADVGRWEPQYVRESGAKRLWSA
jgi:tRNA threonylcarbamoyl adenosine modification protein YeaZ